jgi:hypothetical protein
VWALLTDTGLTDGDFESDAPTEDELIAILESAPAWRWVLR